MKNKSEEIYKQRNGYVLYDCHPLRIEAQIWRAVWNQIMPHNILEQIGNYYEMQIN